MSKYENLKSVFDNIVKGDEAAAKEAFSAYITEKAAEVLTKLREEKSPIKIKGDDVFNGDKKLGSVKHDVDGDKGIEYTCGTSGKKKGFKTMPELMSHLAAECKMAESVKDFESEIKNMPNHGPKLKDEKAFEDGKEEGAKGNAADTKLKKKPKKMIGTIDGGNRVLPKD